VSRSRRAFVLVVDREITQYRGPTHSRVSATSPPIDAPPTDSPGSEAAINRRRRRNWARALTIRDARGLPPPPGGERPKAVDAAAGHRANRHARCNSVGSARNWADLLHSIGPPPRDTGSHPQPQLRSAATKSGLPAAPARFAQFAEKFFCSRASSSPSAPGSGYHITSARWLPPKWVTNRGDCPHPYRWSCSPSGTSRTRSPRRLFWFSQPAFTFVFVDSDDLLRQSSRCTRTTCR